MEIQMPKTKTNYKIVRKGLLYKNELIITELTKNITKSITKKRLLKSVSLLEQNPNSIYSVDKNGYVFEITIGETK